MKRSIGVVLFEKFELLDVFGPLEMFGMLPEHFNIQLVAEHSGPVASAQGPKSVIDHTFDDVRLYDILLIPGGQGTRREIDNPVMLDWLRDQAQSAEWITSVCTGSAVLAKAGLLNGLRATSNKLNFKWVTTQGPDTEWVKAARWVEDGNVMTSSGVSAGMDMALALIEHTHGREVAQQVAVWAEYEWHTDADRDPFAKVHGLIQAL